MRIEKTLTVSYNQYENYETTEISKYSVLNKYSPIKCFKSYPGL